MSFVYVSLYYCVAPLLFVFFCGTWRVCVCTVLKPKIPRYDSPTFWPVAFPSLVSSRKWYIIILLCTVQTQEKKKKKAFTL